MWLLWARFLVLGALLAVACVLAWSVVSARD
jgi:hypothetical protein